MECNLCEATYVGKSRTLLMNPCWYVEIIRFIDEYAYNIDMNFFYIS